MTELKQDMLLEIQRLEKELEFYKTHHMTPLIEVNEHYKHWNNKLSEQLEEANKVIEKLALEKNANESNLHGINDMDQWEKAQGLTAEAIRRDILIGEAREYLEKYK